jgi:CHAT domain-containing protein/uncharacterized protein HemY
MPFRNGLLLLTLLTLSLVSPTDGIPGHSQHRNGTDLLQVRAAVLQLAHPLKKKIGGGEVQAFEVTLEAGQVMRAVVEQLGVDVLFRLYDPSGNKKAEVDSPNGAWGKEPLSFVAEPAGKYRLEVRQLEADALAGYYTITVQEIRSANQLDKNRVAAQSIFSAADELRNQGTLESVKNAQAKYEEARGLYASINDRRGLASCFYSVGLVNQMLGQNEKALELYSRAVPLWQAEGELTAASIIEGNMALLYDEIGDKKTALRYYQRSLARFKQVGDRREEANTLQNIAKLNVSLGRYPSALQSFNQALKFFQSAKRQRDIAYVLTNIGVVYESLGEFEKSLNFTNEALPILRKIGDQRAEGSALVSIANVQFGLGRFQDALNLYNQALPVLQSAGNQPLEVQVLNDIGKCHLLLRDNSKAASFFDKSLALAKELNDRPKQAYILNNFGILYATTGELTKAEDNYREALTLMETVADLHGQAQVLNNLASLCVAKGDKQRALDLLSRALVINGSLNEVPEEGNTLANLMYAWKAFQSPRLAVFYGKRAVNRFQLIRTRIERLDKELQASFLGSKEKVYRDLASLLIAEGRLAEAQQVLRLLKEEEYFQFIRRSSNESALADITLSSEESEWERRYKNIADRIAAIGLERSKLLAKQQRSTAEERQLANLEKDLEAANQRFQNFLTKLAEEFSKTSDANFRIAALRDTQALQSDLRELGAGTVALFTVVGADKYRIILVTPDAQLAREYAITASELNQKILDFRNAVQDPDADPLPLAQELYKIIVGPVAEDLKQVHAQTLMWSLDGLLRYLPIAALNDGHRYLIEQYQSVVFTLASASRLKDLPALNSRGLGMGVSKAIRDFAPLPGVPLELRSIIRDGQTRETGILPGKLMLDEAFTLSSMRMELRKRYPIVHIASHFIFKPGNENDSFLLLGNGEELTLSQIKRAVTLFNGVELLTLSACDTATGSVGADGTEVEAFAVMAQRQGAKAVLAGLWPVSDSSTRLLMQNFYRIRNGSVRHSKAEALRRAQLSLMEGGKYAHPFYWAPFILIGNWR